MSINSSINCIWLPFCLFRLGVLEEPEIDIQEAEKRLKEEASNWSTGASEAFWPIFTQRLSMLPPQLSRVLTKFEEEGIDPGLAIDLGCGNSISSLILVKKGWKVIAVDCTKAALEHLKKQAERVTGEYLDNGQLILVNSRMEDYKFPSNIHLIIATDSLNYCDPSKLIQVWKNAHHALSQGGRIVGNFFIAPLNPMAEQIGRQVMDGWYSDKAVVDALLRDVGYKQELCAYNKKWYEQDPRCIEFIGKKV